MTQQVGGKVLKSNQKYAKSQLTPVEHLSELGLVNCNNGSQNELKRALIHEF